MSSGWSFRTRGGKGRCQSSLWVAIRFCFAVVLVGAVGTVTALGSESTANLEQYLESLQQWLELMRSNGQSAQAAIEAMIQWTQQVNESIHDDVEQLEDIIDPLFPRLGAPVSQEASGSRFRVEWLGLSSTSNGSSLGSELRVRLTNTGSTQYDGSYMILAGLSYNTSWLPEWFTMFDASVGNIELAPGEDLTLSFPAFAIPQLLYEVFRLRLHAVWTDYSDTDSADYVAFILYLDVDGFPQCVGFEPIG